MRPLSRSSSSHRGAAWTGEQGSLHRQCGRDLPRAELLGAGAPRHRRPRKQLAVAVRSTRRLRRAHHYRRQRFASCGRGAFRLVSYAKWLPCLRLRLENVFSTQKHSGIPIMHLGHAMAALLEAVLPNNDSLKSKPSFRKIDVTNYKSVHIHRTLLSSKPHMLRSAQEHRRMLQCHTTAMQPSPNCTCSDLEIGNRDEREAEMTTIAAGTHHVPLLCVLRCHSPAPARI